MTHALVWVVGEGGLLGSHVRRLLLEEMPGCSPWLCPEPRLPWDRTALIESALNRELGAFLAAARAGFDAWAILWCAGAGVIQTAGAVLEAESRTFERFLSSLGAQRAGTGRGMPGLVTLASSAGGVYGGHAGGLLTEDSPCRPVAEYGRQKLRQEGALRAWSDTTPDVGWLVGRFATLYGTGQNLAKPQGLISQMVRALLFRRPIQIYVPLDTQRDFLYVADAARHLLRCAAHLLSARAPGRAVKIFATGRSVTLSEVVALLRHISRQPVRILGAPSTQRGAHPAKLAFRSVALGEVELPPVTSLAAGVSTVYHHQLGLLQRGVLPPPFAA
ncbi:MAG: NAD-dependent epimerase/dehydratase family protein [Candidatus Rokuibacteriota bacterium]